MVSMASSAIKAPKPAGTRAYMNYLRPLPAGKHRLRFVNEGPSRGETDAVYEPLAVEVHPLDMNISSMDLDKNGFKLVQFIPREVDWDNEAEVGALLMDTNIKSGNKIGLLKHVTRERKGSLFSCTRFRTFFHATESQADPCYAHPLATIYCRC